MIENTLIAYMEEMLRQTPTDFVRYMADGIDWNSRLVGIVGPRGVGKSTMLLQRLKAHRENGFWLYVSADHTFFANHSLVDLADDFVKEGGSAASILFLKFQ